MGVTTSFKITLMIRGADRFPELAGRIADLSPVFENIVPDWAQINVDKFALSEGKELSGAQVDPSAYWEPLTETYHERKQKKGFADQIMVRTGALRDALTNPEAVFSAFNESTLTFGAPNDPDLADRAGYNWSKRPTIFLGEEDQNMIRRHLQDYFEMGSQYQEMRFSQGLQNLRDSEEAAQMDVEFNDVIEYDNH